MIVFPVTGKDEDFGTLLQNCGKGRILIAVHERPDGDAIGSASGMLTVLRDNGYDAYALLPGDIPDSYREFVPEEYVLSSLPDGETFDLFLTLDCSTKARIGMGGVQVFPGKTVCNIDHHPDNEGFGDVQIVDPNCASACQLLYRLIRKAGLSVTRSAATRLLLGVITDCGCFRFDNTSPETLLTASELMRLGADHHRIVVSAYCTRDPGLVKLESELLLNRLHTAFDGKAAWVVLTPELLEKYAVPVRNTENLIDSVRNLAGVEFAALLRQEKNGYKLSLRTKNAPYSAGRVARRLNGGGHEMAAGGFITASSEAEAEAILVQNLKMELEP